MSTPTKFIQDGVTAFGTGGITGTEGTVTIGSVNYVVEESSITPNWTTASDKNFDGTPNRTRWTKGAYTGTLTLQLATQSTAYPTSGATFNLVVPNEAGSPLSFVVLGAPYDKSNSDTGIRTAKINVQQVIIGITNV